jgi:hypothetical protein
VVNTGYSKYDYIVGSALLASLSLVLGWALNLIATRKKPEERFKWPVGFAYLFDSKISISG